MPKNLNKCHFYWYTEGYAQQFGVVPMAFDSYASVHSIITPGENGELAVPFSTKEYAQKLLHLMQDAPYREHLAAKGRETVRQFAPERIADMWEELLRKLFSSGD